MDTFIVFGSITLIVMSVCFTRVAMTKIRARERGGYNEDDTRTTQEIYLSLQKMEKRIEALETLLIEKEKHARADRIAAEIERL